MIRIAVRNIPQICWRNAPVLGTVSGRFVGQTPQRSQETGTHMIGAHENARKSGIFGKLRKKFGWSKTSDSKLRICSYLLYESIVDKLNYLEFFRRFDLPDTFNSWFLVTELHVWMVLVRAMGEGAEKGENGRFLRNSIVEAMWSDVNMRARKLDPRNPAGAKKQIGALAEQFQAALINYDEGLMGDDKVLAGALWRRFFEKECPSFEMLEALVKYVRENVRELDSLSHDDFVQKQRIQWQNVAKE
ncbi:ubiquinol-cytochrome-c reductase complex assembly factor 1 [Phlebotomus argentipes]|uniref:ubiquinol-cytochrome-c reductase complex assembly factor 1 n=1 Tax=Phlebotomus argentipes TaxID=94469 RepID=UPI002892EA65|nr:ubiquinol-cytochrome-c reductase complex assembly factor 1 [Phlebotomus argentipes]